MDPSVFLGGLGAGRVRRWNHRTAGAVLPVGDAAPAFFASSFQNRRVLAAMTVVFAGGIATVILPMALGASALRTLITAEHTTIYLLGGTLMLGLGAFTLAGGMIKLPAPSFGRSGSTGVVGVYSLGVFSGVASSCCAPVLAGVLALSGVASSFAWATGLGLAYVVGMVAPLFVISLLWDRYDWRSSRIFRPRNFSVGIGTFRRTVSGTALASGVLLIVMGMASIVIAFTGTTMTTSGWQARVSIRLQQAGRAVTDAFAWLPGWAAGAVLAAGVVLVFRRAARHTGLLPTSHQLPVPEDSPRKDEHADQDQEPTKTTHV